HRHLFFGGQRADDVDGAADVVGFDGGDADALGGRLGLDRRGAGTAAAGRQRGARGQHNDKKGGAKHSRRFRCSVFTCGDADSLRVHKSYIPGGTNRPSTAVQPPSAGSRGPVTKLGASEARKSVGPTISEACPQRLKTLLAA